MIETPKRYAEFLENFGGRNPFGEPNYMLVWCDSAIERVGVPPQFLGPYMRSWVLMEWAPPEEWGSPSTWDEDLMQQPFPGRGLYFPLQIFRTPDGERPADLDSEALNLNVLACWMWNSINHRRDSLKQRRSVMNEEREKRDAAELARMADKLQDAYPSFGKADALSYAGNPGATSALRKRMEQIERIMPHVRDFARRVPKRHSIADALPSRLVN